MSVGLAVLIIATASFLAGVFSMAASWAAKEREKPWAVIFSALWVVCSVTALGVWFFSVGEPFMK